MRGIQSTRINTEIIKRETSINYLFLLLIITHNNHFRRQFSMDRNLPLLSFIFISFFHYLLNSTQIDHFCLKFASRYFFILNQCLSHQTFYLN